MRLFAKPLDRPVMVKKKRTNSFSFSFFHFSCWCVKKTKQKQSYRFIKCFTRLPATAFPASDFAKSMTGPAADER